MGAVLDLLRDEYRIRRVTKVRADTLEALADALYGVDRDGFLKTVAEFNRAVRTDNPFDPNVKDGRSAPGLSPPKSNWANTIDTPPFEAYAVTCGVTFTFGGLRITPGAEVLDTAGRPIPGLFACGSTVGGLVPALWGGDTFSMAGVLLSTVGGALGIWAGYRLGAG